MKLLALACLAGCNVAFGIAAFEPDAPSVDAPSPDAPAADLVTSGTIAQTFIFNDATFKPVHIRTTLSATAVSITVDDPVTAVQTPVPYDENGGTFSVTSPAGTRPRIQIHTGAKNINEFQWDQPKLLVNFLAYTRIGAVATPASTSLTGGYTPIGAFALGTVFATGIFTSATIVANTLTSTYTAAWTGVLENASAHDEFIFTEFEPDGKGSTVLDRKAVVATVNMAGGVANTVPVAYAAVPLDTCVNATTNEAANVARMTALSTSFGPAPPTSPYLVAYAFPVPDFGPSVSWELGYGPLAADPATFTFASTVFPGFTPIIASQVSRQRIINTIAFGNLMIRYDKLPGSACTTQMQFPPLSASFPNAFVVGGTPIPDGDAGSVHFATPTAEVSWTPNGAADLDLVQVVDLTTKLYNPHNIYTTVPHVTIDTAELLAGHQYMIVVSTTVGLPNLAQGDWITHSYPFERAVATSPVFAVD